METPDPLSQLIATRISARRRSLGLSLDELSLRSGVSRAMISRIERGEVHASAVILDNLCAGLGLSLSGLFARDNATPLLRAADQPVWQDPATGYLRREVAPAGTGSPVRIVEIDFPAGAEVRFEKSRHRIIEQHVWMLQGEIEIEMAGETFSLKSGDCLHMRLGEGNSFRNLSGKKARYAVILTLETLP
ncbi:XRE family transcriptional regulator [Dongia mobilis]|uniref:XRE family transcriptional regulator n=1 Tax=Dongia mobilis TaxID=578943 RepID=A0A4V3DEH8_9PROT|nr:XRE family transcriptional regulator [Dongia mobilis]TDQ81401.1 XRE family transcriptional regulator [Dongia mobilis]